MAFAMMAQMMALSSRMMADMDDLFLVGGAEEDLMGPGRGALMSFGGLGGSGTSQMVMFSGGGGGSGFMMSSVRSFDAENPANNFERTQTAQFGPGGVVEAREEVRDGRRGVEQIGLRRQLGEQYAQLERSRHLATGEERSKRTVHNIDEDDVDRFDDRWLAAAQRSLPAYASGRSAAALPASQQRLALPAPPAQYLPVAAGPPGVSYVRSNPPAPYQASARPAPSVHYDPVARRYVAVPAPTASYVRSAHQPVYY
eukprot:EG_transcript_18751